MPERTPSELLANLLLGDHATSAGAAAEMSERGLWENAVRLAHLWRSMPLLRSRVAAHKVALSDGTLETLAMLNAAAAAESAMTCESAVAALARLKENGIRAAAFKGLGMIACAYGVPAKRMLSDADILLDEKDFAGASIILREAGFTPAISMDFDEWLSLLRDRVYPAHDFVDFVDANQVSLDVHWRIRTPIGNDFTIADILDRSIEGKIGRASVRTVAAEDSILLTSHHLVRDSLAPRSAVKDLSDIAALLDGGTISVETLAARGRSSGLYTSVLAALRVLSRFDPEGNAGNVYNAVAEGAKRDERVAADRLAAFFALQLRRGIVSETVVGLTDITPALAWRFIVSRARTLSSANYRRNKFAGSQNSRFGQNARTLIHDLLTLTPARFAVYRTVARAARDYAE